MVPSLPIAGEERIGTPAASVTAHTSCPDDVSRACRTPALSPKTRIESDDSAGEEITGAPAANGKVLVSFRTPVATSTATKPPALLTPKIVSVGTVGVGVAVAADAGVSVAPLVGVGVGVERTAGLPRASEAIN